MKKDNKRYQAVKYKNIKGIRKDLVSKKFNVEKYIRGVRYSKTFDSISKAADWKKNFNPNLAIQSLNDNSVRKKAKKKILELDEKRKMKIIKKLNGNNYGYTFSEVWSLYKEKHLSQIEESSRRRRLKDVQFYIELMDVQMVNFDADLISAHIELKKELALKKRSSRRCNFDNDLKSLKAVLNWYREEYDEQFVNPILKSHRKQGIIKNVIRKKKKLRKHELLAFFEALEQDSIFWRDFAETQFYCASRVQETAGLLIPCVDLVSGIIEIQNVMIWGNDKNFLYLKTTPKNNEEREVSINNRLSEILRRRLADRSEKIHTCPKSGVELDLVFHLDGEPLSYRAIQYRYNKALKKIGLFGRYSSTHIMRHTMANMVRSQLGLDSAQAVGGWKTRELVENIYTDTPVHVEANARLEIEKFLHK